MRRGGSGDGACAAALPEAPVFHRGGFPLCAGKAGGRARKRQGMVL